MPIFHKGKEVLVKSLPDGRIGQTFEGMSIVEHFFAMENNRLIRVSLKISMLDFLHLGMYHGSGISKLNDYTGEAEKLMIRILRAFPVGIANFVNINSIFHIDFILLSASADNRA
ncbi:MAG: hypothetical protein AUK26_13275 [Syntrophaceae bacterium CG2_30_58_14]|nr:MAG: hypothetical protein AUK26_13275 [Syntrophaceae bacterium CG2_30_58_14]